MRYPLSERASTQRANWFQRQGSAARISVLVAGLLTIFVIWGQWKERWLTPLQAVYLWQYFEATSPSTLKDEQEYTVYKITRRLKNGKAQTLFPTNAAVVWNKGDLHVSPQAWQEGWRPKAEKGMYRHDDIHKWLKGDIYEGKSWFEVVMTPVYAGGGVWMLLMIGFMFWDRLDRKKNSKKKVTTDTETQEITPDELDAKIRGEGLGTPYLIERNFLLRMLGAEPKIGLLRVRLIDEQEHFMVVADTRQGKSVIIHWWLAQIADRSKDRAVIYDASLEFWERHGDKSRGDILLHPLATEMPYWDLAAEIETAADAEQIARAFFPPEKGGEGNFWDNAKWRLFGFLLVQMRRLRKGIPDLLQWMEDPDQIDEMIELYEPALLPLLNPEAANQRAGVVGSMNLVAAALKLLPGPDPGRPRFSFREWAAGRHQGWIFIGCRFPERNALRPLVSAWIDMMLGNLMVEPGGPSTFLVLDELPTLQRLPRLKDALQEAGKYNLKFIMAFQGRAQLEALYGRESETLMSAPGTRIFLKTKEYSAAEWASRNIGMPEQEREVESITAQVKGTDSESRRVDRKIDYIYCAREEMILLR